MKTVILMVMLAGVMTKVETVHYSNGRVVQRTYDKPSDTVPSDIKILSLGRPYPKVAPEHIIEHREVLLSNYWQQPWIITGRGRV